MMKMDYRDSAECQNWEKRDVAVIFAIVYVTKGQKKWNSDLPLQNENEQKRGMMQ